MDSIWAALTLLAARKSITKENLQEICRAIGYMPSADEIKGILLLQQAFKGSFNPDGQNCDVAAQPGALQAEINMLRKKVVALEKHLDDSKAGPLNNPAETGKTNHATGLKARYLYGIVELNPDLQLERAGIDNNRVYLIPVDGLAAVVHQCDPEPYVSNDEGQVRAWVEKHNTVLEECLEKFPAVLPYTFNTVLHKNAENDPDNVVVAWLKKEAVSLKRRLGRVRNQREYGVQLFWDKKNMAAQLLEEDRELAALKEEITAKPAGTAYMYKEKLERLISVKMEARATSQHRELIEQTRQYCTDFKVEKNKKAEDNWEMIGNWSFLVAPERVEALGLVLDDITKIQGYKVQFTGPWPPYNFVD